VPYRELTVAAPCHVCDEAIAAAACDCCGKPTCARHLGDRSMCSRCDEAVYMQSHRDGNDGFFGDMGLLVVPMIAAGVAWTVWTPLFVVALIYIVAGFPVSLWLRRRRRRARLIARIRASGELPPTPSIDEHDAALARYDRRARERALANTEGE
jgi:hypothetical protein